MRRTITLFWFMSLMREFQVEVPKEAREKISSIRRFLEMSQIPQTSEAPYSRIGPGS